MGYDHRLSISAPARIHAVTSPARNGELLRAWFMNISRVCEYCKGATDDGSISYAGNERLDALARFVQAARNAL